MRARRVGAAVALGLSAAIIVPVLTRPAAAQDDVGQVLQQLGDSPGPQQDPATVAGLVDKLAHSKAMGKTAATVVVDAESGDTLYDDDAGLALVPASTNKITTSFAVLRTVGPNRTLKTRTTLSGKDLYVIGGGDPLLISGPPRLEFGQSAYPRFTSFRRLAKDTAAALKARGTASVSLKVDDSFFTGPSWGKAWPDYYRTEGIVAPVSALMVDDGRIGGTGAIATDPAEAAGDIFAGLLRKRGVTVTGVRKAVSPQTAEELAAVTSAPVYELVGQALTWSDNDTAESLFRLAGRYGESDASFAGGSKAVTAALSDAGISTVMTEINDGSGLSPDDRLSAHLLAEVLRRVVQGQDDLWPIASGLAVAGVSGTLQHRFDDPQSHSAAGWVRGKTGTLNFVSTLAGFVQSRSGRVLVYASMANEAKNTIEAGAAIDKIVGRIADCGCPGDNRDNPG